MSPILVMPGSHEAELLAGEPAAEDVEGRDVGDRNGVNVAGGLLAKIRGIGLA